MSLERLDAREEVGPDTPTPAPFKGIGLSATVPRSREAAQFLVGSGRTYQIVRAKSRRPMDFWQRTPLRRNPYPRQASPVSA